MCSWAFLEVCVQLRDDDRFGLNIIVSQHLNEVIVLRGCRCRLSKKPFSRKKYLDVFRAEVGYLIDFRARHTWWFGGQHGLQSIL